MEVAFPARPTQPKLNFGGFFTALLKVPVVLGESPAPLTSSLVKNPASNKHLPSGAHVAARAPCFLRLHYWKCQDKNGPKDFWKGSEKEVLFLLPLPDAVTRCRAGGAGQSDL